MNGLAQGPGPYVSRHLSVGFLNKTLTTSTQLFAQSSYNLSKLYQNLTSRSSLFIGNTVNFKYLSLLLFRLESNIKNISTEQLVVNDNEVLSFVGPRSAAAPSFLSAWSQ